jgi:uncharacterized protein YjbJ (UPF0337 family)
MNIDTLAGEGTNLKGHLKESLGDATGDPLLQRDGIADQLSGNIRKGFGALRDFSRDQPLLTAVGAGAVVLALFGNLRGRWR